MLIPPFFRIPFSEISGKTKVDSSLPSKHDQNLDHSQYKFCKKQRLLNSADFQNVFSDPPFRASHQYCLILAKPNQLGVNRLGMVIAKKHIRLAVHRNRIKRLIRESFRHLPRNIQGIDAIVLARKGLGELENSAINKIVNQQWQRIQKKANAQSA